MSELDFEIDDDDITDFRSRLRGSRPPNNQNQTKPTEKSMVNSLVDKLLASDEEEDEHSINFSKSKSTTKRNNHINKNRNNTIEPTFYPHTTSEEHICDDCESIVKFPQPIVYCGECAMNYCTPCDIRFHHSSNELRAHIRKPLHKIQLTNNEIKQLMQTTARNNNRNDNNNEKERELKEIEELEQQLEREKQQEAEELQYLQQRKLAANNFLNSNNHNNELDYSSSIQTTTSKSRQSRPANGGSERELSLLNELIEEKESSLEQAALQAAQQREATIQANRAELRAKELEQIELDRIHTQLTEKLLTKQELTQIANLTSPQRKQLEQKRREKLEFTQKMLEKKYIEERQRGYHFVDIDLQELQDLTQTKQLQAINIINSKYFINSNTINTADYEPVTESESIELSNSTDIHTQYKRGYYNFQGKRVAMLVPADYKQLFQEANLNKPDVELQLTHQYGYSAKNHSILSVKSNLAQAKIDTGNNDNNNKYRINSTIIYPSNSVVIVEDIGTHAQRIFRGHDSQITAITKSIHHSNLIATGQIHRLAPNICIWDSQSLSTKQQFYLSIQTVESLAFNSGGDILAAVVKDMEFTPFLYLFKWKTKQLIAQAQLTTEKLENNINYYVTFDTNTNSLLVQTNSSLAFFNLTPNSLLQSRPNYSTLSPTALQRAGLTEQRLKQLHYTAALYLPYISSSTTSPKPLSPSKLHQSNALQSAKSLITTSSGHILLFESNNLINIWPSRSHSPIRTAILISNFNNGQKEEDENDRNTHCTLVTINTESKIQFYSVNDGELLSTIDLNRVLNREIKLKNAEYKHKLQSSKDILAEIENDEAFNDSDDPDLEEISFDPTLFETKTTNNKQNSNNFYDLSIVTVAYDQENQLLILGTMKNQILSISVLTKSIQILVSSPFNSISCLALHPSLPHIALGSEYNEKNDYNYTGITCFHYENWQKLSKKSFCTWQSVTAAAFSAIKGEQLTVGLANGQLTVYNYNNMKRLQSINLHPNSPITLIKYTSSNSHLLFVQNHRIYINLVHSENGSLIPFKSITTHSFPIQTIHLSMDNQYIQTIDTEFNNYIFSLISGKQIVSGEIVGEQLEWQQIQTPIGFNLQALAAQKTNLQQQQEEEEGNNNTNTALNESITVITTSYHKKVVFTGDNTGRLKVFRYPCYNPAMKPRVYNDQTSAISAIICSSDDSLVFTSNGNTLFQWRLVSTQAARDKLDKLARTLSKQSLLDQQELRPPSPFKSLKNNRNTTNNIIHSNPNSPQSRLVKNHFLAASQPQLENVFHSYDQEDNSNQLSSTAPFQTVVTQYTSNPSKKFLATSKYRISNTNNNNKTTKLLSQSNSNANISTALRAFRATPATIKREKSLSKSNKAPTFKPIPANLSAEQEQSLLLDLHNAITKFRTEIAELDQTRMHLRTKIRHQEDTIKDIQRIKKTIMGKAKKNDSNTISNSMTTVAIQQLRQSRPPPADKEESDQQEKKGESKDLSARSKSSSEISNSRAVVVSKPKQNLSREEVAELATQIKEAQKYIGVLELELKELIAERTENYSNSNEIQAFLAEQEELMKEKNELLKTMGLNRASVDLEQFQQDQLIINLKHQLNANRAKLQEKTLENNQAKQELEKSKLNVEALKEEYSQLQTELDELTQHLIQ